MDRSVFSAVDLSSYLFGLYPTEPGPEFAFARSQAEKLGKEQISLGPLEGRILSLLIRMHGAKKIVEVGTLTGVSALWLAHGMIDGNIWTLELDPKHVELAKESFSHYSGKVKIHLHSGNAEISLQEIEASGPFDAVFIDANKSAYLMYLKWAKQNLRMGGLLIADNVFLRGAVANIESKEFSPKQAEIMKSFNQEVQKDFDSAIIPSREGLLVAIRK